MALITHSNLADVFRYHPPANDFQIEKFHGLREAAKAAALVVLDQHDLTTRQDAILLFERFILAQTGPCQDQVMAVDCLIEARALARTAAELFAVQQRTRGPLDPYDVATVTNADQAVIAWIRGGLMWANSAVALEALI
jgi:hypothetical protein